MPKKPPIQPGAITEAQFAPHLRRRLRGTGGRTMTVATSAPSSVATLAEYEHSTTQTLTLDAWESGGIEIATDTATVSSSDVIGTAPFVYTRTGEQTVTVSITYTASDCVGGIVVAYMVNGRDRSHTFTASGGVVEYSDRVVLNTADKLTIGIRACALGGSGGTVVVDTVTVAITR